ncbi:EamA family transporter [Chloroflexi bacterium TSY]|nr:EamA family transporter [Chloroflexi bacterium TSY]
MELYFSYSLLILSVCLGVIGQLLLKQGMSKFTNFQLTQVVTLIYNLPVVIGFSCYGISILVYLQVLENLALSVAYPTISLGYVLVIVFSNFIFKEPISRSRWAAVIVICIGVVIVGMN